MKSEIIERLGETDILLPSLIAEGLAANDRIKARLSVMQAAGRHARDPNAVHFDLTDECRNARIDPMPMEALVTGASLLAGERITAPGLANLEHGIWDDPAAMVEAVKAGDPDKGDALAARLSNVEASAGLDSSDTMEFAQIHACETLRALFQSIRKTSDAPIASRKSLRPLASVTGYRPVTR